MSWVTRPARIRPERKRSSDTKELRNADRARRRRRQLAWLLAGSLFALLLPGAYFIGLAAAPDLLAVETPLRGGADMLVVLGGDAPPRVRQAVKLYFEDVAPLVLVSGHGDCLSIRDSMVAAGVPAGVIETECASETTWENAEYSAALIRRFGVRRAVLVTSWYHSRRALACFRAEAPGVEWLSSPAPRGRRLAPAGTLQGTMILEEYLKIAWYAARYGILALEISAPRAASSAIAAGPSWTHF